MTSTQPTDETAGQAGSAKPLSTKLEIVVIPVSDVDRARDFYVKLGWRLDADFPVGDDFRVVQVTPPDSKCSVILGKGVTTATPGSVQGLHLIVSDVEAACAELAERGVDVSGPFHDAGGVFHHGGEEGRVPGLAPERASYGSFASFEDPDGNGWVFQEITGRLPGRVSAATYDSAAELQEALIRVAAAHGKHEERTGEADAEWPVWYAEYMYAEQTGAELPT